MEGCDMTTECVSTRKAIHFTHTPHSCGVGFSSSMNQQSLQSVVSQPHSCNEYLQYSPHAHLVLSIIQSKLWYTVLLHD